jgi:hypothetical protein
MAHRQCDTGLTGSRLSGLADLEGDDQHAET